MAPTPALSYGITMLNCRLRKLTCDCAPQYTAAAKQGSLDTISKALDSMHSTFKRDTRLQSILSAPVLSDPD